MSARWHDWEAWDDPDAFRMEETGLLQDTPSGCVFDDPMSDDWHFDWKVGLAIHPNSPVTRRRR